MESHLKCCTPHTPGVLLGSSGNTSPVCTLTHTVVFASGIWLCFTWVSTKVSWLDVRSRGKPPSTQQGHSKSHDSLDERHIMWQIVLFPCDLSEPGSMRPRWRVCQSSAVCAPLDNMLHRGCCWGYPLWTTPTFLNHCLRDSTQRKPSPYP